MKMVYHQKATYSRLNSVLRTCRVKHTSLDEYTVSEAEINMKYTKKKHLIGVRLLSLCLPPPERCFVHRDISQNKFQ